MSDYCSPGTSFPNAALMQQMSTNSPLIWQEICMIQQAVLAASSPCLPGGGQMCTTVGGATPMTFVSSLSAVTVVNGGSEYYADVPAVEFIPPVGSVPSVVATATAITNGGNITAISMTNYGSGYQSVPASLTVSSIAGVDAVLVPLVNSAGNISGVDIVSGGSGYTDGDSIVAHRAVVANAAYINAHLVITAVSVTGEILSVAVIHPGTGYQPSVAGVRIVSTLTPGLEYPLGAGFSASTIVNSSGEITQVIIENMGAGYATFNPYLVISNQGTGAATSVTLLGTSVESISVDAGGIGYVAPATGVVFNPPSAALPNPPADAAVVSISVDQNTFGTDPLRYWNAWTGAITDRAIELQLNQVLSYFKSLGYTIVIQTNPSTGSTIQWKICW